ncbi:MAG: hypothetical protein RMK62_12580, partial [Armatimonadota bacterium]|nr:hypothetical protein [Armatimonadota bacterium]
AAIRVSTRIKTPTHRDWRFVPFGIVSSIFRNSSPPSGREEWDSTTPEWAPPMRPEALLLSCKTSQSQRQKFLPLIAGFRQMAQTKRDTEDSPVRVLTPFLHI